MELEIALAALATTAAFAFLWLRAESRADRFKSLLRMTRTTNTQLERRCAQLADDAAVGRRTKAQRIAALERARQANAEKAARKVANQ